MAKRVVITGMGTVNPLAHNVRDTWERVKKAENGLGPLTRFDSTDYSSKVVGEVKDFDAKNYMDGRDARRMDRFSVYGMVASLEAMQDAGLQDGSYDPERIGVVLGNGIGGIEVLGDNMKKLFERGPKAIHPLVTPMMIANIAAGNVAIRFGAQGPCYTVVTACASATDGIGQSLRLIRDGAVDMMITGGTEAPITPLGLASFCVLQAVSTRYNDQPDQASRPFDRDRDGFIMSEGAGIVILEELEHAKKRGARIYAEVAGYGATCDANHLTAPHPEGRGAAAAMRMAIADGGLKPEDVDYINAHGTSTPINDPVETKAVKLVFGDHAWKLKMSSSKSMHGHLLGAAGGVEGIITVMGLVDQFYPATRNYENADPECDLDYVPNQGVSAPMRAAISNSLGFGGHNGVVLFKRYQG